MALVVGPLGSAGSVVRAACMSVSGGPIELSTDASSSAEWYGWVSVIDMPPPSSGGRPGDLPTVGDRVVEAEVVDEIGHLADELGVGDRRDRDRPRAIGLHRHVDRDIEMASRQCDGAEREQR